MINNAEKIGSGIMTAREDPRITNVGRILRKTSIDELPQIFNIIRGDMSLVGPRSVPVGYYKKYSNYGKKG